MQTLKKLVHGHVCLPACLSFQLGTSSSSCLSENAAQNRSVTCCLANEIDLELSYFWSGQRTQFAMREHSKTVYRLIGCSASKLPSGLGKTPIALLDDFDCVVTNGIGLSDQIQFISRPLTTHADHCGGYFGHVGRSQRCAINDSFSLAIDRVCLVTYDLICGMGCSLMSWADPDDAKGRPDFDLSLSASDVAAAVVSCSFNDSSL